MSKLQLIKYIEPPSEPVNIPSEMVWNAVEQELSIIFPADYRLLINTYGSGLLGNFYWIWNPFKKMDFISRVRDISKIEQSSKDNFPEYYPYDIYPEKPGFFPCASDDNGNYYGWYTEGHPDLWPLLTHEVRGEGFKIYNQTLTGYLTSVFSGEVSPLSGEYPGENDYIFIKYKDA